jgi:hypothetical protein
MKKIIKTIVTILVIFILCMISFGVAISLVTVSPQKAIFNIENYTEGKGDGADIYWFYDDQEYRTKTAHLYLDISQEDFKQSLKREVMRHSSCFDPAGVHAVDPNDKYVKQIAEDILERTKGFTDKQRVTVALNFVQTGIDYEYDDRLCGGDFILLPLETLYLGVGDCEDKSILLMSIYLAMGYDAVLLSYYEHVAVGVRWSDDMNYLMCETTLPYCSYPRYSLIDGGEYPHIYSVNTIPDFSLSINEGIGWYRKHFGGLLGI